MAKGGPEADYFPLVENSRWTYRHRSSDFRGEETVEILIEKLEPAGKTLEAKVLLTRRRPGTHERKIRYRIRRSAEGVFSGGGVLGMARQDFLYPLHRGRTWTEPPDRHVIAGLDAEIETPAGRFTGCLRVDVYLAGGDAGSAVRFYAPGVGCVHEGFSSESLSARIDLTDYSMNSSSSSS